MHMLQVHKMLKNKLEIMWQTKQKKLQSEKNKQYTKFISRCVNT